MLVAGGVGGGPGNGSRRQRHHKMFLVDRDNVDPAGHSPPQGLLRPCTSGRQGSWSASASRTWWTAAGSMAMKVAMED